MANTISEFAEHMVDELCIGIPKYINRSKIVQDITIELEKFNDFDFDEEDTDTYDFIQSQVPKFQNILFIIKDNYIADDDDRCLSFRVKNHDIDTHDFLMKFLRKTIGRVSSPKANVYG